MFLSNKRTVRYPSTVARINQLKLVSVDFEFSAIPGTRHRRSTDEKNDEKLKARVQTTLVFSENPEEQANDLNANVRSSTIAAAEKSDGTVVSQTIEPVVKTEAIIKEAGNSEDIQTEIISKCPTDACWDYNVTAKACSLKDNCTDVECTHKSIIAKD